jgi:type II secretory pathway pseudopilin PulG
MNLTIIIIVLSIVLIGGVVIAIVLYLSGRRREREDAMARQTANEEARLQELYNQTIRSQEGGAKIDAEIRSLQKEKPTDDYKTAQNIIDTINRRHG